MLIDKDLRLSISGCFWLFYASKYNEVKQKVTSDWDFENREKYKDEAGLKKQRIEAARAIGVAFGNGQQPVTTNITWLH